MSKVSKEQHRAYYHARTKESKDRKVRLQRERRRRITLQIREYRASLGCMDCGENNPLVLDFDHRDRGDKSFEVSDGVRRGCSFETIMKEIEKCDVVCANCHRIRTAKQMDWPL